MFISFVFNMQTNFAIPLNGLSETSQSELEMLWRIWDSDRSRMNYISTPLPLAILNQQLCDDHDSLHPSFRAQPINPFLQTLHWKCISNILRSFLIDVFWCGLAFWNTQAQEILQIYDQQRL